MTKALKTTLLTGLALLGVYALLRLGFLLANRAYFSEAPAGDVLAAFFYGLRFDVAGLVLLNAPVLMLHNLPLPTTKPRWLKRITFALFALLNTCGFLLNMADFGYYPMVQRRITFEPFQQTGHLLQCVPGWLEEFPLLVFGGLATLALLVLVMGWFQRLLDRRVAETPGWIRSHLCGALLLGLSILAVRGGLQDGILRPADAFSTSRSTAVGNLTLNSTYTVLLNVFLPRFPAIRTMGQIEAVRTARAMTITAGDGPGPSDYPFLRSASAEGPRRELNVVILIQESWTWANVGPNAEGVTRTPFFDGLAREGALFTNFLANAQRSSEAVPSVIASVPSVFRRPIIGSQVEMQHYRGLGDILGERGYTATFHHGASPTIEGFRGFSRLVGFDHYYSRDDYEGNEPEEERLDGKWGIFDHLFYVDAAKRIDAIDGPFASVIFGLSPHDPYHIPPSLASRFETDTADTPYQRHLRYSDHALGEFFAYARTRPWFAQTVFFVTADHTRFAPPDSLYESFHVPLLVYAPGLVEPQVRPEIAAQVDILPTVIDLLRLPTRHASMGRSVFDNRQPRFAVVQRAGRYAIFGDELAYMHDLRNDLGLYAYRTDRLFRENLAASRGDERDTLHRQLFAYLQAVTTAVVDDRVWPKAP